MTNRPCFTPHKWYLSDTCTIPYENMAKWVRYPPLRYYLEKVLRDMGGVSRTGPLRMWVRPQLPFGRSPPMPPMYNWRSLAFFLGKPDNMLPKSRFSKPVFGDSAGSTKFDRPYCKRL